MDYGYLDFFISNIGENMDDEVAELKKYASDISIDHLSYRPNFNNLIAKVQKGDTIYAYNIARFSSGLRDLVDTLKLLNEKEVSFVSIKDNISVDKSEQGQAVLNALIVAAAATSADPQHGHYL